jgi:hypothetical protein
MSLDGDEWSASRPGLFTSVEIITGTYWIGDWLYPTAGLDAVEKIKNLLLP